MISKEKRYISIFKFLLIIFLPISIFFTILQFYALSKDFYLDEFEKYNIYKATKMSKEDVSKVTDILISYIKGETDNLSIKAKIDGKIEEVFGQREKQHMVDVQRLFNKGYRLRNISFMISLLSMIIIILLARNKLRTVFKGLFWSGVLTFILMISLFILVKIDFYKYFTIFHEIFFTNDLWVLNPKTDVLIQMLPLEFFTDITVKVLSWFIGILLIMIIISYLILKKITKN